MKKIYISGKITGLPKDVYEKYFNETEDYLIAIGYEAINPLKVVAALGIDENDYPKLMGANIEALLNCDYIYLLDNWRDSKGARAEKAIADIMGIKIYK
jgi:hypothetical protein